MVSGTLHNTDTTCVEQYRSLCAEFQIAAATSGADPSAIIDFLSYTVPDSALEAMVKAVVPLNRHSVQQLESFNPLEPNPNSVVEVSITTLMNRVAKLTGQDLATFVGEYNDITATRNAAILMLANKLRADHRIPPLTTYTPTAHDTLQNYLTAKIRDFRNKSPEPSHLNPR